MKHADFKIFLTVGSEKQKLLCEKLLLSINIKNKYLINVISDNDTSFRLGSGGAVLNVLHKYYNTGEKLLIINSGGFSKRCVNYALRGKAFTNVLFNGKICTLLELIISESEKLMQKIDSGILICCSDILVTFNTEKFPFSESFGVCIPTNANIASRHGVMLCNNENELITYLHKRSSEELKELIDTNNLLGLPVDTGITFFNSVHANALYEITKNRVVLSLFEKEKFEINLYSDIISLFSKTLDKKDYLSRETSNRSHHKFKEILFDHLSDFSMKVFQIGTQEFLHFGSTAESLRNTFSLSNEKLNNIILNSSIDDFSKIGQNTILDNVQLNNCTIGNNNLISDVYLEDVSVENGTSVCGIKLCDGSFVTIVTNINENPKKILNGISLWETPLYYKATSFSQSLKKYYENIDEEKISMSECFANADYDYLFSRQQYLRDMRDYSISSDYLKKREEILSHHFNHTNFISKVVCTKDKVEVSLPLRVNLSGTWTDAMPYCIENGGQVINLAVLVDGKKPVKVLVEKLDIPGKIEFCSDGATVTYILEKNENDEDLSDFILHKAALQTIGLTDKTLIKSGFRLTTEVKGIDKGSGLGTSSILLGGCFIALSKMFGINLTQDKLLKMVFVAEQIMKTGGGWQDQAGGLTSGLKAATTVSGIDQELDIKQIPVSPFFDKLFSERIVLLPTGQRHFGRFIVNDVVNRYLDKVPESIEGHLKIRALNDELIKSFDTDDYSLFVQCINKHRALLRMISHKVTNPEIEKLVETCFEKADAVSYLGAGGGGYLLVILNAKTDINSFCEFIKAKFPSITSPIKKIDICYNI